MSISSITSFPSYSNPAVEDEPAQSSSYQRPAQLPGTNAQDPVDTVDISQAAQIQQLAQQGESAAAIASAYGLTVSDVDSDLGISTTSSSVPIAAPTGHGGEHPAATAPASAAPAPAAPAPAAPAPAPAAANHSKIVTPAPTLSLRA